LRNKSIETLGASEKQLGKTAKKEEDALLAIGLIQPHGALERGSLGSQRRR
jgi:hypothetical protein